MPTLKEFEKAKEILGNDFVIVPMVQWNRSVDGYRTLQQQNEQMKDTLASAVNNWHDGANEKAILFTLDAFLQSLQGGTDNANS